VTDAEWQDYRARVMADARARMASEPDNPLAYCYAATMVADKINEVALGRFYAECAARLNPTSPQVLNTIAWLLWKDHQPEKCVHLSTHALSLYPDQFVLWNNLSNAYRDLERLDDAEEALDRAARCAGADQSVDYNRALLRLTRGDQTAWREYAARWRLQSFQQGNRAPISGARWWNGEPLAGQTILVWWEQGNGDNLQFLRYVPMLQELGAKVVLEVPGAFHRLARQSFPDVVLVTDLADIPAHDWQTPILSLAGNFGVRWDGAYLGLIGTRMASTPRVGFVWSGSPGNPGHPWRTTALAEWRALISSRPEIEWVSLQQGGAEEQLGLEPWAKAVMQPGPFADWAATLDTITTLDLVITVDTAVAHLAAGAGVPVWLLLARPCDFRWGITDDHTAWYPSMRLFRQAQRGDWRSVFTQVMAALPTPDQESKAA
jgi:tetratricopeptide (TPR) repeat protein